MKITAAIFKQNTGEDPIHDDLERCNCTEAGRTGHQFCGWCEEHDLPRSRCGCAANKKEAEQAQQLNRMREILGDYRVVDLPAEESARMWQILKDLEPFHEACSMHIGEWQFKYEGKIYHAFFPLYSDAEEPSSIGVRKYYEWGTPE